MRWTWLRAFGHALCAVADYMWLRHRPVACVRVIPSRRRGHRYGCAAGLTALAAIASPSSVLKAESLALAEFAPYPTQGTNPTASGPGSDSTTFSGEGQAALGQGQVTISRSTKIDTAVDARTTADAQIDFYDLYKIAQDLPNPIDGSAKQAGSPDGLIDWGLEPIDLRHDYTNIIENDLYVPGATLVNFEIHRSDLFAGASFATAAIPEPGTAAALGLCVVVMLVSVGGHRGVRRAALVTVAPAKTSRRAS